MKQIKYIFLSAIICIAAIALVFQSCNNENGVSLSDSASEIVISSQYDHLDLPKEYQQIGQYHNECLDTVFTEMNKNVSYSYQKTKTNGNLQYVQTTLKSLDYNSTIKNALLKYAKSNTVLNKNYAGCVQAANFRSKRCLVKGSSDSTIVLDNLNATQQELIDRIHSALNAECQESSLISLKEKLNKINKEATAKLTKEAAISIYCATSVAYNSFQYWKKNINKWGGMLTAYGVDNSKCKELKVSGVRSFSKSIRFKSDYFELADGSYLLPEVTVYPYSTWNNVILPIINADCDAAAGSIAVTLTHAAYIELISGGTATPAAIGDIIIETSISAGGSSGYAALGILTGWW